MSGSQHVERMRRKGALKGGFKLRPSSHERKRNGGNRNKQYCQTCRKHFTTESAMQFCPMCGGQNLS